MENFEFKGHPENADAAYWEAEKVKWMNGSFGLTGRHYFYLTIFCLCMPDRDLKYATEEYHVFNAYQEAIQKGNSFFLMAPKELDTQSMFGASEALYRSMLYKGSTVLITSSIFKNVKIIFDKIIGGIAFIPDDIKPMIKSKRKGWYYGFSDFNQVIGRSSSTKKGVGSLQAFRADHVFIDDASNHRQITEALKSARSCISMGFSITGTIVASAIGKGTDINEFINSNRILGELLSDYEIYNLSICFVPSK